MYDVITIGTATRDVFLTSKHFKVLKDKERLKKEGFKTGEAACFSLGSKVEVEEPLFTTGGGALNAAVTFGRLGLKTATIFKVGGDSSGEEIIESVKSENVIPLAIKDKRNSTAYSVILISSDGERTILVYRGAAGKIRKREIDFSKIKAHWAYIVPNNISLTLMRELLIFLKKSKICVAMNPSKYYLQMGKSALKPILEKLDVVVMNREEASYLTRVNYENVSGIFKEFDRLVPGIAVMTDGENGASVSDGRYIYEAGAFKEKNLVDRTGAGDAFGSAFVAGLMLKNDINYALRMASANATSVVEKVGAQSGILNKDGLNKKRFKYLDMNIELL